MNIDIEAFNGFVAKGAQDLLRASWEGGVLIAIVAILCHLLPRLPARARNALWWLACLKLLLSLVWATPLELALLPPHPATMEQQADRVRAAFPAAEPGNVAGIGVGQARAAEATPRASSHSSGTAVPALPLALMLLWLIGAVVCGSISLVPLLRLRRLLRTATKIDDPELQQAADDIAAELEMRRTPGLLLTSENTQPLALGCMNPVVLLSRADFDRLSAAGRRAVLAHEFAHIRRADLWFGLVPLATQVCFWFHPCVWLACREFALSREAACDIIARRATRMPILEYGHLLLSLGTAHAPYGSPIALGVASDHRMLQRRILMMHQTPRCSRRLLFAGLTFLFAGIIALGLIPWRIVAAQAPAVAAPAFRPMLPAAAIGGLPGQQGNRPEETLVTINLSQPLVNMVETTFRAAGGDFQFRFDPALTQGKYQDVLSERIRLYEQNVPLTTFLRDALDQASIPLTFRFEQNICLIGPAEPRTRPAVKVPLNAQHMPLDQVVDRLCHAAHVAYRLDLAADMRKAPVTVDIKNATVPQAFSVLLGKVEGSSGNLYWRREDGIYVIAANPPMAPTEISGPKLKADGQLDQAGNSASGGNNHLTILDIKNGELSDLLRLHLAQMGWNFVCFLPSDMHDRVSISCKLPAMQALDKILTLSPKARQLAYRIKDDIMVVAPASMLGNPTGIASNPRLGLNAMNITMRFKQADAYMALKEIFRTNQAQFTLDPSLRANRITVAADNASFDDVLQKIAAACTPPMTVKLENEVYSFVPK